ncbi:hypothetical protein [Streptomyces sp. AF1A]|uniref:hypothetical protein n=1 Tax=Streptomyces sp. AF1A TaxID=3394350 RepID=UPI0039BC306C
MRIVHAVVGESLAGILAGAAADVLVFSTMDDPGLSGTAGRIQISLAVALTLLFAVGFLVHRPRELRDFGAAVVIEEPSVRQKEEQTRLLRRGRVRIAIGVFAMTLVFAYGSHGPLVSVSLPLIALLGVVHTWRTAIWWERRHGVRLWKPALVVVGREAYRRSPYYATPAPHLIPGGQAM